MRHYIKEADAYLDGETERERRFSVYEEAPGFRPGPRAYLDGNRPAQRTVTAILCLSASKWQGLTLGWGGAGCTRFETAWGVAG